MNTGDDVSQEVREFCKEHVNFFEIYRVYEFQGHRQNKAGKDQKVRIELLDAGPEAGDLRFHCRAVLEDGRYATGNAAKTVDETLAIVHWWDLDNE